MTKAFFAAASIAALMAVAAPAGADTGRPGYEAAQALAGQIVGAAKGAEAADQGQGKSETAVEADIEAAVLAQIRDSSASPDVVAEAIRIARRSGGLDNAVQVALGSALELALGVTVPGPGSAGRASTQGGASPFGHGVGNGGGGGGSGYRGH